eukprot:TRINITY_DN16578_c0_g1_i11.p4 TRINITY_DN16578_c0_g1~~TRINITY_DN16578_c0_g1_i11.p4  ORF type:complete len:100 (+),score=15.92 TRINITY_DN16578_c0_g1_i11:492-791(+)
MFDFFKQPESWLTPIMSMLSMLKPSNDASTANGSVMGAAASGGPLLAVEAIVFVDQHFAVGVGGGGSQGARITVAERESKHNLYTYFYIGQNVPDAKRK